MRQAEFSKTEAVLETLYVLEGKTPHLRQHLTFSTRLGPALGP